jgi:flagellar hook-associated protein 1 FlgK
MSTFGGIESALSGLRAQQLQLETTTNNVANAGTPGYHRQLANLVESAPLTEIGYGASGTQQVGTGVNVASIQRMVDPYVAQSLQIQLGQQGAATAQQDATSQIQGIFNDLSGNGINSLLDKFWSAWQDVASSPTDLGVRASLVGQAQTLASTIQQSYQQLQTIQASLNQQFGSQVGAINALTSQIAVLNSQIVQALAAGQQPNDLMDQRDQLVDQLSGLVQITVANEPSGAVQIALDGSLLVDGMTNRVLATTTDANGMQQLTAPDGTVLQPGSGTLGGIAAVRDGQMPENLAALNAFANRLITAVNAVQSGVNPTTGAQTNVYDLVNPGTPVQRNFFTGTGAGDIAVNADIVANPALIAASQTANGSGDGSNAAAMAALQQDATAGGAAPGVGTLDAQYQAFSTSIGTSAQTAQTAVDQQQVIVNHLQQLDAQMGGVSLDEEAAHLVTYQQSYQAAARALTTFDEMLNTLINNTGLAGRS